MYSWEEVEKIKGDAFIRGRRMFEKIKLNRVFYKAKLWKIKNEVKYKLKLIICKFFYVGGKIGYRDYADDITLSVKPCGIRTIDIGIEDYMYCHIILNYTVTTILHKESRYYYNLKTFRRIFTVDEVEDYSYEICAKIEEPICVQKKPHIFFYIDFSENPILDSFSRGNLKTKQDFVDYHNLKKLLKNKCWSTKISQYPTKPYCYFLAECKVRDDLKEILKESIVASIMKSL